MHIVNPKQDVRGTQTAPTAAAAAGDTSCMCNYKNFQVERVYAAFRVELIYNCAASAVPVMRTVCIRRFMAVCSGNAAHVFITSPSTSFVTVSALAVVFPVSSSGPQHIFFGLISKFISKHEDALLFIEDMFRTQGGTATRSPGGESDSAFGRS